MPNSCFNLCNTYTKFTPHPSITLATFEYLSLSQGRRAPNTSNLLLKKLLNLLLKKKCVKLTRVKKKQILWDA